MTPGSEHRHLEEPAFLGREFPLDPDPYAEVPRDRSTGALVLLDLLLITATLAYASERAWFVALFCGVLGLACGVVAWRKLKFHVEEEMRADPSDTLKTMVQNRRR